MNDILNPSIFSRKIDTHMQRVLSYIHLKLKRAFSSLNEAFQTFDKFSKGCINLEEFKDTLLIIAENLYVNDANIVFRMLD